MPENFFDFREKLMKRPPRTETSSRASSAGVQTLTVSQLTQRIDAAIQQILPQTVHVSGELSNVNLHRASGHLYFTLKDASSCVDCVMWKSDRERLKFDVLDGHEVLVTGSVKVYAERGRYQLYARKIEPMGQGALELAFRQLCAKLEAQGLFDPSRKKTLPAYPVNVALVTSREGAALQDMLKVLRRFAFLRLMLFHVPVQGEQAGERIAGALKSLGREEAAGRRSVDVIMLARGGGSLEDLWAFNEESVARAMAACPIPIVTGIGHEVDTSIADLVADHHAHTPTEAAQVITANWKNAGDALDVIGVRMRQAAWATVSESRQKLSLIERHEIFRRPTDRINQLRQRLDDRQRSLQLAASTAVRRFRRAIETADQRLRRHHPATSIARFRAELVEADRSILRAQQALLRRASERVRQLHSHFIEHHPQHRIRLNRERIEQLAHRLDSLSTEAVLKRGFSITRLRKGGAVIRSSNEVQEGDRLVTRLADGEIESTVRNAKQHELFD